MKTFLTFYMLLCIKVLGRVIYYFEIKWIGKKNPFKGTKLIVLLNHTSLFEPIFLSVLPTRLLWEIAKKGILPGADVTMNRPIAGSFLRLVASSTIPISRRRDKTWTDFLEKVREDSVIVIAAEGRMKRPNGLDKNGNPMTVRGGVSDLLERVNDGKIVLAYSGGLHHVMRPDQKFPRLFKRIKLSIEIVDVGDYKAQIGFGNDSRAFRLAVIRDLERRRELYCPKTEEKSVGFYERRSLPKSRASASMKTVSVNIPAACTAQDSHFISKGTRLNFSRCLRGALVTKLIFRKTAVLSRTNKTN